LALGFIQGGVPQRGPELYVLYRRFRARRLAPHFSRFRRYRKPLFIGIAASVAPKFRAETGGVGDSFPDRTLSPSTNDEL
jgi:hypothetical protein